MQQSAAEACAFASVVLGQYQAQMLFSMLSMLRNIRIIALQASRDCGPSAWLLDFEQYLVTLLVSEALFATFECCCEPLETFRESSARAHHIH